MPPRAMWVAVALGVLIGAAVGAASAWLVWGRPAAAMAGRMAALESSAARVEDERNRLHEALTRIVHERKEMAATAEHLREQVEQQLHRLDALSAELTPPPGDPSP